LARPGGRGRRAALVSWLILYGLVGGQVAWTLKPFLGTPYLPALPPFRLESGNIYVSFFSSLNAMSKGGLSAEWVVLSCMVGGLVLIWVVTNGLRASAASPAFPRPKEQPLAPREVRP
jgi:hypothetical protein